MASLPPASDLPARPSQLSRSGQQSGPSVVGGADGIGGRTGVTGVGGGTGTRGSIARIPPHNFEAEESLLGAMLLSRDAIAIGVEEVVASDFYRPSHGHVFTAVTRLYAAGEPVDAITVAEEMRRQGTLDLSGGAAALVSLQANTPAISSAVRYARIVQENAVLRRLIGVAYEIAEIGYELPSDVAAALDHAEAMVFEVAQRRSNDAALSLKDLLTESLEHLEYLYDRGEAITGVPTGYTDLDAQLYGLQPSNLVVVGARPSVGKTAFALGIAANAAKAGVPVLMFTLEMGHLELAQRVLCSEARVDAGRLRNGKVIESDWTKIAGAIGRIGEAPLYIDDNPNVTVMDIRSKSRRMKSTEGGLGLVVVDYLQLMTGRTSAESRQVEISEISRGLKLLARELSIPVVACSQLSRTLESRADKRPMLADLRECLPGDTEISLASGGVVTLGSLARSGAENVSIWSLDADCRLAPAFMAQAWSTGIRPVFAVRLASDRVLRATDNHPLLTPDGWTSVGELKVGDALAVAQGGRSSITASAAGTSSGSRVLTLEAAPPVVEGAAPVLSWERIESVTAMGAEEVFDAYVPGTHSFLANGIVSHNSGAIEQDADVVMFIYRDEVYNPESSDRGTAEIHIAKHRNGPTGIARLSFISNFARFGDLAKM